MSESFQPSETNTIYMPHELAGIRDRSCRTGRRDREIIEYDLSFPTLGIAYIDLNGQDWVRALNQERDSGCYLEIGSVVGRCNSCPYLAAEIDGNGNRCGTYRRVSMEYCIGYRLGLVWRVLTYESAGDIRERECDLGSSSECELLRKGFGCSTLEIYYERLSTTVSTGSIDGNVGWSKCPCPWSKGV